MTRYAALVMALISFASWAGTWQLRQGDEGVMLWTQPHPPTSFQGEPQNSEKIVR